MKKTLKKLFNEFMRFFVHIILFFIKKDNKIIIIGDFLGKRFGDNSKYLYLYLNLNKEKYKLKKIIWITRDKEILSEIKNLGYEVYTTKSIKAIYYHLKSKYHIIDQEEKDIIPWLSFKSIKINLWHGMPLKKIMLLTNEYKTHLKFGDWENSHILTCSKMGDETIGKAFGIKGNQMIKGGYPKVDCLVSNYYPILKSEKKYINLIKEMKKKGRKILIYLPTFRDKMSLKIFGEESKEKLEKFFNFLENHGYFLIMKFHMAKSALNIDTNSFKYILNLESKIDVYPFLKECDILITDYSSVYFDFLSLNREIIFYPYDLDYYLKEEQGLIYDYYEITPGDKAYNLNDLTQLLELKRKNSDPYLMQRKELYEKCYELNTIEETVQNILKL